MNADEVNFKVVKKRGIEMSMELLKYLNGRNNGIFKRYLDGLKSDPLIAWYPSANEDFRPLLYLSPAYSEYNPPKVPIKEIFPDIFLFTDYFPWGDFLSFLLRSPTIYQDNRTIVSVDEIEELPSLALPLDPSIVHFPNDNPEPGKIVYLKVRIKSKVLGECVYPVIYVFTENEVFCSKVLLEKNSKISHVIHVRYGGGLGGGGAASGIWILGVLKKLHCKVFVTDGHYAWQEGDKSAMQLYPNLLGSPPSEMKEIRMLESEKWSGHGNVKWYIQKEK